MGAGVRERALERGCTRATAADHRTTGGAAGEDGGGVAGAGVVVHADHVERGIDGTPEFNRRVYADILQLRWGETTSYGDIARRLGDVALSRAVGAALGANPIPLLVPCHRVLASNGRAGGFSAPGGVSAKMKMLALEHAASPTGQYAFGF